MTRTLLAALALGAVPATAAAQSIAYEGFNYNNSGSLNGLGGGTGWGNSWNTNQTGQYTIAPGSLGDPTGTLATGGNRLDLPANGGDATAGRSLSTNLAQAGSVWVSFVISRTGGTSSNSYGGVVIGNSAGTSPNSGRLFIGDLGSGDPSDTWGLERATGGAGTGSNFTVNQNPTALLVVHIQFGRTTAADLATLYVNPQPGGETPPTSAASLSLDIDQNGPVNDVGIWYSGDAHYQIDEIRFGNSFADVTPVPEPGPVLALAAGVLAAVLCVRRLRRPTYLTVAYDPPPAR